MTEVTSLPGAVSDGLSTAVVGTVAPETKTMIRILFAAVAILSVGATTASAQSLETMSSAPSMSRVVKTGDLNLSTDAGARLLLKRVHIAAASACAEDDAIYRSVAYVPCIAAATDQAVQHLGNPVVAALNHHQALDVMTVASAR